jgi:hypothetical protein
MISHDRYSKRSTHGNDSNTGLEEAEGILMGALAGGLAWFIAFIVIGAIAVGW